MGFIETSLLNEILEKGVQFTTCYNRPTMFGLNPKTIFLIAFIRGCDLSGATVCSSLFCKVPVWGFCAPDGQICRGIPQEYRTP